MPKRHGSGRARSLGATAAFASATAVSRPPRAPAARGVSRRGRQRGHGPWGEARPEPAPGPVGRAPRWAAEAAC